MKALILGGLASVAGPAVAASRKPRPDAAPTPERPTWAQGLEGQRRGDLGDGTYLNPVLAGDHPDPTVLKDGDDYWMTSSSMEYSPGLIVWHSRDLVNWVPVGPALTKPMASVYAADIAKHDGRYFIYFPSVDIRYGPSGKVSAATISIHVVHAASMRGPWSDPVDMGIPFVIDPGHVVGEDGKRYLFFNEGKRVRLTDDGLKADGPVEKVYDGWQYPADWVVEAYSLEGPKLLKRDGWFYMISAVGGTAGPPTSHLVIMARSRSVHGPWENCPANPIVRTVSAAEPWWSRGHATAVEGQAGDWWLVYHGYENGRRTLGRQMLLEPMEWTDDGWIKARGGDLSRPLAKPKGAVSGPHGVAQSDDFSADGAGIRYAEFQALALISERIRRENNSLIMRAQGEGVAESSPLVWNVGDHRYEMTVEVAPGQGARGGLLLFYNSKLFCGLGVDQRQVHIHQNGADLFLFSDPRPEGERLWLRIINDNDVLTMAYSTDNRTWKPAQIRMEMSGYHQNVGGGFLSLRPALYACGEGEVVFRNLTYRALSD